MKWTQHFFFELSLWTFGAEVEPHLTLKLNEYPRRPYAYLHFDNLCLPFSRTYRIFSSPWDSNLTSARLYLQWNWHRKTFWTVTFELLGRNIAPLHFNTERLAETALRTWWFWQTSAKFPGIWGIFSTPWVSKLTPACLGLELNVNSKTFWTLPFQLLGRKV